MGAGYFIDGIARGMQFKMQYDLSKNNMDLYAKQIDAQEAKLKDPLYIRGQEAMTRKLEQEVEMNQMKLDAYGKQGGAGGVVTPMQKSNVMQLFDRIKGNASILLDNPSESKRYMTDLEAIVKEVNKVDIEGKPYFSQSEREKVMDFTNNINYYAILQKAEGLTAQGNVEGLKQEYDWFSKNPKEAMTKHNLTAEQYNKITKTLDPGSKVSPRMMMLESEIDGTMKSWTINKKTGVPEKVNVTDIDNKIAEIQGYYQQGKISDSFYSSKMATLKGYAIKADMARVGVAKGEGKYNSVAQATLSMVDDMIPQSKKNDMEAWSDRYDYRSIINSVLSQEGIDLSSVSLDQITTAQRISNKVLGEIMVNKGYKFKKDEDPKNPTHRRVAIARHENQIKILKAEETLRLQGLEPETVVEQKKDFGVIGAIVKTGLEETGGEKITSAVKKTGGKVKRGASWLGKELAPIPRDERFSVNAFFK